MVDPRRMRALLDRLGSEIENLRRLAATPPQELLADEDLLAAVKYRFIVAIEICIDAGQHFISSEDLRAPENFADVFAVLGEADVLPKGLAESLQRMARFRNVLVHAYLEVDDKQVVQNLQSLEDLQAFRRTIAGRVEP